MATYNQEYLEGVKDGRLALKECTSEAEIKAAASADLHFCRNVSECAYSAMQADYIKGLQAFWKYHLAKLIRA